MSLKIPLLCASALLVPLYCLIAAVLRSDLVIEQMGDDALFFVRYAHNFLSSGRFSWNIGESPAFGSTSQLYQLLTTAGVAFLPGREAVAVAILPAIMGSIAVLVLLRMSLRLTGPVAVHAPAHTPITLRVPVMAFAALLLGFNPKLYGHWFTGMETTTSIAAVALLLHMTHESAMRPWYLRYGLPAMIVLLCWVRPDLVVIAGPVLLLALGASDTVRRRSALTGILLAGIGLGLSMAVWWLYYGSPVPLPALIKTALSPYARTAIAEYHYGNVAEFFLLLREDSIAFLLAIYFFLRRPYCASTADMGLALGACTFILFEMFGNKLPITSGGARFLMPVLPIMLWYAIRGFAMALADLLHMAPGAAGAFATACIAVTLFLSLPIVPQLAGFAQQARRVPHKSYIDALKGNAARVGKWPIFASLFDPDLARCGIADSEIGAIGLAPVSRTVYDMSGLNNVALSLRREDAASYLARKAPDIVWYRRIDFYWGTHLSEDARFRSQYRYYPGPGIAVLNASPCAQAAESAIAYSAMTAS